MNSLGPDDAAPRWGRALAVWCGGLSAFQAALAIGAPWGAAAWGGRHSGVLPGRLRLASGASAAVAASIAAVSAGRLLGGQGRRRVLLGTAVYTSLGIAANGASPSALERAIWTPMCALGAFLAVQSVRETAQTPE